VNTSSTASIQTYVFKNGDSFTSHFIIDFSNGTIRISEETQVFQRPATYNGSSVIIGTSEYSGNYSEITPIYYSFDVYIESTGMQYLSESKQKLTNNQGLLILSIFNITQITVTHQDMFDYPFSSMIDNNKTLIESSTSYGYYEYYESNKDDSERVIKLISNDEVTYTADIEDAVITTPAGTFDTWRINLTHLNRVNNITKWFADGSSQFDSGETNTSEINWFMTYYYSKDYNIVMRYDLLAEKTYEVIALDFNSQTTETTNTTSNTQKTSGESSSETTNLVSGITMAITILTIGIIHVRRKKI
jgi:hypothetical protein